MAHPKFLIAPAALHVDTPEEAAARAILDEFLQAAAVEAGRIRWEPYRKLGPHSRMSFYAILPDSGDDATIIAEIDRICACLVGEHGLGDGHTIDFVTDSGDRHYERIFSLNPQKPGFYPRTHWFHIELDLYTPIQKRLRKFWREDRAATKGES